MAYFELRFKNKEYEARIISKITQKVFAHFGCAYVKDDAMFFLDERLQWLFEN